MLKKIGLGLFVLLLVVIGLVWVRFVIPLQEAADKFGPGTAERDYALQDNGLDTVDANHALGFDTDERLFLPAARILQALNVSKIQLITNNPDKISQLEQHGIHVTARVPLALDSNPHNRHYLKTKKTRTGHLIDKI